ncbi:MAG: nucleoside kinase [Candidatus Marinimicrobia bacterium]|nr:nucleoside kinase [Candidatus Neomarinimicrobiota bacterium]
MSAQIEAYRHKTRALIFLLSAAVKDLFGETRRLVVDHSLGDGYYCVLKDKNGVTEVNLAKLEAHMRVLQLEHKRIKIRQANQNDWKHLRSPNSRLARPPMLILGEHISPSYEFTNLDLSALPEYTLMDYDNGFLLRFGENGNTLKPFIDTPKLYRMMKEHEKWGRILKVSSISDLNKQILEMGFKQLIWVAEGLHEKRIAALSDAVLAHPKTRVIFVAGPSSSGKTTFTRRLSIHLAVNGIRSHYLSMDDYYLDRDKIEPQSNGILDYESVDCLDLDSLRDDLSQLVAGNEIHHRHYDFVAGKQEILKETLILKPGEVLIFEGIHGLNPMIHRELASNSFFKVYISALTQLNIDNTHPVSTSDGRLIRRIVRDHKYRGYSADETLKRWNSVRHGELHNIFPYQEQADVMFNSALLYELSILKRYALPLLRKAEKSTIRDRLITLLSLFHTIPDKHVPGTSILREFIGNSYFTY